MLAAAIPKCDQCGEPVFHNSHQCPPTWRGRIEGVHAEGELHPESIYAVSPMAAARRLAEIYRIDGPCMVTVSSGEKAFTLEIWLK